MQKWKFEANSWDCVNFSQKTYASNVSAEIPNTEELAYVISIFTWIVIYVGDKFLKSNNSSSFGTGKG